MPIPTTVAVLRVTIESDYGDDVFDKLYKVEATELADESAAMYALFEHRSGGYGYLETIGAADDITAKHAVEEAEQRVRDYAEVEGTVETVATLHR